MENAAAFYPDTMPFILKYHAQTSPFKDYFFKMESVKNLFNVYKYNIIKV